MFSVHHIPEIVDVRWPVAISSSCNELPPNTTRFPALWGVWELGGRGGGGGTSVRVRGPTSGLFGNRLGSCHHQ